MSVELANSLERMTSNGIEEEHITRRSDIVHVADVVPNKSQKLTFFDYWKTMGADDAILTDDKTINNQILQKWFRVLVVRNDRFPKDIPVEFVLDRFFDACTYHKITVKGHNLMAHTRAFNEYMNEYGDKLRGDWWHSRPDKPKELTPTGTVNDEENKISNEQRVKNLKFIYGDNMPESIKALIEKLESE